MLHRASSVKRKARLPGQELQGCRCVSCFMILLLVVLLVLLGFYPQPILDTSHSAIGNSSSGLLIPLLLQAVNRHDDDFHKT
ncbi:hypothetical protein ACLK1T_22400 [Escherichia coli]